MHINTIYINYFAVTDLIVKYPFQLRRCLPSKAQSRRGQRTKNNRYRMGRHRIKQET